MVDALLTAGLHGYREGNFLSLLQMLRRDIDRHFQSFESSNPQTLMSKLDANQLFRQFAECFKSIMESLNPIDTWFDKTGNPQMIDLLPALSELWPGCRIIFCKRRGIENIISRQKKFPGLSFEFHCRDWSNNMSTWRNVRVSLDEALFTEVDQYHLISQPAEVAASLSRLLGLDGQTEAAIERIFRTNRPQQTAAGTAESVLSIHETGWSADEIATFRRVCTEEMLAYGYALD